MSIENAPPRGSGTAWHAAWDGGGVSLAAAVDGTLGADSWVQASWGSTAITTDGRAAAIVRIPGRDSVIVVDGRFVAESTTPLLTAQLPSPILRERLADMAPLVHEQDSLEARVH